MKAQYVIDLLKNNKNRFTAKQLESATGTPRRARRALFLARKAGVVLEAIRDGGKAVIAYQLQGAISQSALAAATAAPARKASKAKTPKAAAKAKKVISKEVAAIVAKNKAPSKSTEEVDAVKAKNLATMKEVTKREKTALDKIKEDTRAEFDALEAEWEAEEAARAEQLAARVAVAENLPRANVLAD
jgi:hypothetical protein